jgi:ribosomal-protein-alanine N-acetyltransferase
MAVVVRLSEENVPDLAAIERESNRPPWNARLFASEFSNQHSTVYGLRNAGEVVGFVVCHTVLDEAHLLNVAIAKAYRGQGLGRELLKGVLEDLNLRTVRWVTLEVRRSNHVAKRLYESLGFLEVGVRKQYYTDDGEDGITMRLDMVLSF